MASGPCELAAGSENWKRDLISVDPHRYKAVSFQQAAHVTEMARFDGCPSPCRAMYIKDELTGRQNVELHDGLWYRRLVNRWLWKLLCWFMRLSARSASAVRLWFYRMHCTKIHNRETVLLSLTVFFRERSSRELTLDLFFQELTPRASAHYHLSQLLPIIHLIKTKSAHRILPLAHWNNFWKSSPHYLVLVWHWARTTNQRSCVDGSQSSC